MKIALLFCLVSLASICKAQNGEMWIASIEHGKSSFNPRPDDYQVFRNVMDFGCRGDGVTDDTACINTAISSGGRCGNNCGSSTETPALVYFPSGRYLISSPIIMYYFTQLVGNVLDPPTLVAAPSFEGMAIVDSNPYDEFDNWYINQNNFFRQVRNFIIDTTQTPVGATTTGIHWQVAQATSLVNIHFVMSRDPGTGHQGIWMENGSGGFMSDLVFEGGKFGMWVGNQQFLSRNMTFNYCQTAIFMNWNWQWTFKNTHINNCQRGIEMYAPSDVTASGVGSILLMDSSITDTPIGIITIANPNPVNDNSGTLLLENVRITNVPVVVQAALSGETVLPGGSSTITRWGRGSVYLDTSGNGQFKQDYLPDIEKDPSLLDFKGDFLEISRPQYGDLGVDDFSSVKSFGATGDGNTDDSTAIQNAIDANINGKVVYFPAGTYILSKTVFIPVGTRIIGETWSYLMASGVMFQDQNNPQPMLKVGNPGDAGVVEITDMMFGVRGAQPGVTLVEWNVRETYQGSCGMWDTHFRVGGTTGSNLQVPQCPKGQGHNPLCESAYMLFHLTPSSSGYFENVWAWTADHDLDNGVNQGQITIYVGRGVLIESQGGPVWLYGTQSEHNVLYQYQLINARNVFMTMIQSETPYWQPGPKAPIPFNPNPAYFDPTYSHCEPSSSTCALSYALRSIDSSNIYLYGGGLYNFFNNYDQTCLLTEDCQDSQVTLTNNSRFYIFNLNTKAAKNMVVSQVVNGDGQIILARQADNRNNFCSTINAFLTQA